MNYNVTYRVAGEKVKTALYESGWLKPLEYLDPEDMVVFLALNQEGSILCFAVAINSEILPFGIEIINYTNVGDDVPQEVSLGLLDFMIDKASRAGCKIIYALISNRSQAETLARHLGFTPNESTIYGMECGIDHFDNSEFKKLYRSRLPEFSNIIRIEDYNDSLLQKLVRNYDTTGFFIPPKVFDSECSRFYIEEGEVRAAICMKFFKKTILQSIRLYQSPKIKSKRALACLIAVMIYEVGAMLTGVEKIVLLISYRKIYDSLKQYFPGQANEIQYRLYYRDI